MDVRRFYGIGLVVLGLGNILFGLGQLLNGPQAWYLALLELIAGFPLVVLGWLVVSDSDRLSDPKLSGKTMLAIGAFGVLAGLFLLLGGILLLLMA